MEGTEERVRDVERDTRYSNSGRSILEERRSNRSKLFAERLRSARLSKDRIRRTGGVKGCIKSMGSMTRAFSQNPFDRGTISGRGRVSRIMSCSKQTTGNCGTGKSLDGGATEFHSVETRLMNESCYESEMVFDKYFGYA